MRQPARTMARALRIPRVGLRTVGVGILAVLVAGFLVACSGQNLEEIEPEVGVDQVEVDDNTFDARVVQVTPGTTVTWTWVGGNDHNVVGEGFQSDLQKDGTFQHTFDTPGWYKYICTLHGGMTGAVSVVE